MHTHWISIKALFTVDTAHSVRISVDVCTEYVLYIS